MPQYYDGTKLLSMKDLNGNTPEIFLCTTNRTGGKTTYFNRLVTNKYLKGAGKFGCFCRYKYELQDFAEKFFKDIGDLFFPDCTMTGVTKGRGLYQELFINDVSCGYALPLNCADQLKKYSHFFNDIDRIIFDEFQSESNNYCSGEVQKFISLHQSIARGKGKQNRYVPVYMLSNAVSLINPYYTALGISERLQSNTNFLKGDGWVLEQGYVESAALASSESGFNKAFANSKYILYSTQNVYLNDELSFVEKLEGKCRYCCTLKYEGEHYGVWIYPDKGLVYCDRRVDMSHPFKISVTTSDHEINHVMLGCNRELLYLLRDYFNKGCFRFKDLACKKVIIKTIS